jgi:hypothetical protein
MKHASNSALRISPAHRYRRARWLACGAFLALAIATPLRFLAAQRTLEIIGRVEGLDFTVEPPPGAPPVTGEAADQLTSGSRIVVRSGQARIVLQDGGEILICGAARIQLLKSGDALTIALDFGTLRVHVESASPLAIFTPQVIATTVAIGAARDATIGLDKDGRLCVRAALGAVRIQQQFGDQTLLVPQFGALTLSGSQIAPTSASASGCTCNLEAAKLYAPRLDVTVGAVARHSQVPPPIAPPSKNSNASVPPVVDGPIFKILMPTLVFNASSPDPPPDPSSETILLVRTAVVHGEIIYRGSVVAGKSQQTKLVAAKVESSATPQPERPGVMARIGGFFRRLFGG